MGFQETDSYIPPEPSTDGVHSSGGKPAASTAEENCKWVQATIFKVKYSTEFEEKCTTEEVEECTTAEAQSIEVEECRTVFNTVTVTVTEEVCTLKYQDVC